MPSSPYTLQTLTNIFVCFCKPSLNSWHISSWIRSCCTFICATFKSHTEWNNCTYQYTNYRNTTKHSGYLFHSLNSSVHMIHAQQTCKILQNFRLTLVKLIQKNWVKKMNCLPLVLKVHEKYVCQSRASGGGQQKQKLIDHHCPKDFLYWSLFEMYYLKNIKH